MSADEDSTAVVIDNGSAMVKAGLAGEDAPRMVFPSLIGRPKRNVDKSSIGNRDFFVGEEAQIHRGLLTLTYPIENGVVTNWDDMERVWHHTFYNELKVEPENLPVLMAEAPLNPTSNREKMMEVMFEKFQVPGFYVSIQAVLSMYAGGRVSAIMLDSGDGLSHVLPIYEGRALVNTIRRVNFAGSAMTTYLTRLLNERGNCFTTSAEREIVRDIKEKHCYVSEDYDAEMTSLLNCPSSVEKEYELPDGRIITIGNERFRVPECLFQPDLLSIDCEGLHESVVRCLQHCDIDTRADLYCNIVLSGGNTMFPGLPERLKSEIKKISPQKLVRTNVVAYPSRKYHVWIGGSILASFTTFNDMYIRKQEYEEEGPRIVHRKCF